MNPSQQDKEHFGLDRLRLGYMVYIRGIIPDPQSVTETQRALQNNNNNINK